MIGHVIGRGEPPAGFAGDGGLHDFDLSDDGFSPAAATGDNAIAGFTG